MSAVIDRGNPRAMGIDGATPIFIPPELAKRIGWQKAAIAQRLDFLMDTRRGEVIDDTKWVYVSMRDWYEYLGAMMNENTIRKHLKELVKRGIVAEGNHNHTRTRLKWYTLNRETIKQILLNDAQKVIRPDLKRFGERAKNLRKSTKPQELEICRDVSPRIGDIESIPKPQLLGIQTPQELGVPNTQTLGIDSIYTERSTERSIPEKLGAEAPRATEETEEFTPVIHPEPEPLIISESVPTAPPSSAAPPLQKLDKITWLTQGGWGGGETIHVIGCVLDLTPKRVTIVIWNERAQKVEEKHVTLEKLLPRTTDSPIDAALLAYCERGERKVPPHIAIIDAYHNALPSDVRPPGVPAYERHARAACDLRDAGITAEQVREYVSATYDTYREWARKRGSPALMSLEHIKTYIKAWLANRDGVVPPAPAPKSLPGYGAPRHYDLSNAPIHPSMVKKEGK